MKKVLSLLIAFVFMQVQTWALSGGPFQSGGSGVSVVGTYAGVLIGNLSPTGVGNPGGAGLGIFTIGLPSGGIGTGIFALFSGGQAIGGDVIGLGDPNSGTIRGVMRGVGAARSVNSNTVGALVSNVTSVGVQFEAEIEGGRRGSVAGRLVGTASATVTFDDFTGPSITTNSDFTLTGYRQSGDSTLATATALPGRFSSTGGS